MAVDRIALLSLATLAAFGASPATRSADYAINVMDNGPRLPRKKRRKGRTLSDVPFGPPSPFETRQQRRYRIRMEAKRASQMKKVRIND